MSAETRPGGPGHTSSNSDATATVRTVACLDRDFVEWHGGCTHALVWAVEADVPDVRAALASARVNWGQYLLPRHDRQPHVTLAYAGPLPRAGAKPQDEPYTLSRLDDDLARLRAAPLAPFILSVGGWGTFPMVPFLHAAAPELGAANTALMAGSAYEGGFVPHVTIGHYAVSRPLADVAALAGRWAEPAVEPFDVATLSLLSYETHDIAGALTLEGRLFLRDGSWEWAEGSQLRSNDDHGGRAEPR